MLEVRSMRPATGIAVIGKRINYRWALAFALGSALLWSPAARAQALTFDLLHTLDGAPDGSEPEAALFRDATGNLFGTAAAGGNENCDAPAGCGTVFEVNTSGQ